MSTPKLTPPPRVFIGSSSEALTISRYMHSELQRLEPCEPQVWDQGVFALSSYALESLADSARGSDFAVLVVTADDLVASRDTTAPAPRDNVVFELGLFIGALGRERTYVALESVNPPLRLPSDLQGLTYVPFVRPPNGEWRVALNEATLAISERIRALGRRDETAVPTLRNDLNIRALDAELDALCADAIAQGWKVRKRNATTLRLQDRKGRKHTLSLGQPNASRADLRGFAKALRANGLRVNHIVRNPVPDSPYK